MCHWRHLYNLAMVYAVTGQNERAQQISGELVELEELGEEHMQRLNRIIQGG